MEEQFKLQRWSRPKEKYHQITEYECGPCSSVGIATGYGLDGPGTESRWGARYSTTVLTGPGANPVSCTMGTESFPEVKSGRGVTLTPHPFLVPWSWKDRAVPLFPVWAVGLYRASVPVQGRNLSYLYVVYSMNNVKKISPGNMAIS